MDCLLVFLHLPGGSVTGTGRGLLRYAGRLAGQLNVSWQLVIAGVPTEEMMATFSECGVPAVTTIAGGDVMLESPAVLGRALARLATEREAGLFVLPHDELGAGLAPVIAAAIDAAILTEVTAARPKEGGVRLSRQAIGGRLAESWVWDRYRPLVLTVSTRNLRQANPTLPCTEPQVHLWHSAHDEAATTRVTGRIPADPATVDLAEAEVIFSAGKGCDPAMFGQLTELCLLLNVSLGVTRPLYDLGWSGFDRMVGQTGRTVAPRLYLALGISGSVHHLGGIRDSRRVIALNSDVRAPIFPNADEGFVCDLREVLPRLLVRAKAALRGAP